MGDTERCVNERLQEPYREARVCAPQKPWGEHHALHKPLQHPCTASFIPFTSPPILSTDVSYVNRRIREPRGVGGVLEVVRPKVGVAEGRVGGGPG